MTSQREVKRKYAQLMKDVATKDYYKTDVTNRVNTYWCKCGHWTKTRDIDPGCTPMFHKCESCNNPQAVSTFYKDKAPEQQPTQEWYRPTLDELMKKRNNEAILDHVFNGGLLVRKIKINEAI